MPKYIIEREIPGAGSLAYRELQDISQNPAVFFAKWDQKSSGWKAM